MTTTQHYYVTVITVAIFVQVPWQLKTVRQLVVSSVAFD